MFKIYLLNSANHPTKIYDDVNVYNPIVFEPELDMNGDNGILVGKLTFKLHDLSIAPQLRLLQNTMIVTQMIASVETVIFRGRPLLRDDDDYNDQDFTFEGILSGLNDTLQPPSNKRGVRFFKHFINIMDWHNNNLGDYANNRQIDYSKITSEEGPVQDSYMYTITEQDPVGILWENMLDYTRYRASTMDHLKTQYVDAHGGFFYLENEPFVLDANGCVILHNYLKYVDIYNPEQAHINEQRIEFGKNLISIKRSASADDFATVLIPLGTQLTDLEKTWPYYQSTDNNKLRKITYSPDDSEIINYTSTGVYINSETGAAVSGVGSGYVMPGDVNVEYGDVFYLTTYLEGISTNTSIASYAVLSRDGQKVFAVGSTVRNSNDSTGKLVLKDERIEIPTPEDTSIELKLRTSYLISANDPNGGYVLKKLNKNYKEDNVTIMSAAPQITGAIRKTGQHPIGRDVYPDATTLPTDPEPYEQSKRLVNQELFDIFGPIEKSVELPDYGFDKLDDLIYWASKDLEKMGEDLEIEIQAADLGYIDERNEFFHPYDLVPVYSEPHGIDMMLPIVKMTLPLADPAAAVYTLQNDIHLSEESKKYISQMVSTPGSTGQKNQTVVIYGGRGGSGGGSMPTTYVRTFNGLSGDVIYHGGDGSFPVYTPQDFGAVGDMEHDDTQAFKDAFAASSRGGTVFVPDGRYRLTDTIKIPRWGMMVLSGSVELRFFDMEDGNGGWKPCIKLRLYARLKGNGSLVIVDYNYKGHAIELYTDEDPLHQPNEPFVGSNPAWRQSRDVDEIAILKRAGEKNAETSVTDIRNIGGDGIYIGAQKKTEYQHTNAATSRNFQWTAHVNARIAGGFENGFHLELKDRNESWMSDTYISGVVENTETAVLIDHVSGGVYCDITFQPLLCYPSKLPTWTLPASEEDAYGVGDRVHYPSSNSPIYESTVSNNMGAPDGTGWKRAEEYVDDVRHLLPVWDSAKAQYQTGSRVHYPTENDPVYESDVDNNTSVPTGSGWHRAVQYVSDEPFRYVKNGVKVVSTANVDMTRTKIWDWQNALHDVPDKDGNYSHQPYALIGSSRSAIIYDYGMDNSRLPFHSRIYSNGIGNILTATIKSAFGLLPVPPKYAFYKNYRSEDSVYNYLNLAWRDPQNLMRFQMPFKPLYPGSNANQLYQLGYFDFADAEVPQSGINDTLVRQTITIEENDDRGLYGYTNLYFEENVAEARWNPVGYGTGGHIPIYFYSSDGTRRYIYRLVRDNTDIQQIYNCQLYITNARRFIFDFQTIGEIGSLSADTYKLIQPQTANADLYLAGSVTVQNGVPMVCTESAVFGRDGRPTTAATVKPIALAEDAYQILDYIEGDGASYINTGIVPSATTKIMARFNAASVAAVTSAERQYIFGTYSTVNGDAESRAQFCYGGSDFSSPSRAFAGFGGGVSSIGYNYFAITPDTDEHYIRLSAEKVLFDDLWKLTLDNTVFTDPKPIYLFACDENGAANHFSKGIQIEAVSIYDGDTRIARFLPALRKSDGALGMLDEDSGEFFPNMGTGTFRNDTIEPECYNVTLNADGTVNTVDSALDYNSAAASVLNGKPKKLIVTWGNSLFTARADEKLTTSNGDIKFIADVEHDGIQRHMIFTLNSSNTLTTTLIETYSRAPVTVWEVTDVSQGLLARNTNISSTLNWHLTNLNLAPFKRIKIYSRAGRKTGATAQDSSITPASIIEMSLDNRAMENVSQNVFIGSSIVQNPNDANRLGILTCAVSADKTKFAVVRSTTLYGTAATSNTDAYTYVFKIEGCYD